jgi:hypothetical protein
MKNNTEKTANVKHCSCGGIYAWDRSCGADVCEKCGDHKGLALCFCGWAADGGNGREQLEEMGETIDPD